MVQLNIHHLPSAIHILFGRTVVVVVVGVVVDMHARLQWLFELLLRASCGPVVFMEEITLVDPQTLRNHQQTD